MRDLVELDERNATLARQLPPNPPPREEENREDGKNPGAGTSGFAPLVIIAQDRKSPRPWSAVKNACEQLDDSNQDVAHTIWNLLSSLCFTSRRTSA